MEAVVWNTDVQYKPELEVDIDLLLAADDIPGEHYAELQDELEVELTNIDDFMLASDAIPGERFAEKRPELEVEIFEVFDEDGWFLGDDEIPSEDNSYCVAS